MGVRSRYSAGMFAFYDSSTQERSLPVAPVVFYDDFIGPGNVILEVGSEESGVQWTKKLVGNAPPTVGPVADAAGGHMQCALTNASQEQSAYLYMSDSRHFDLRSYAAFEARVRLSVLPTSGTKAVWGFGGDYAAPNSVTYSAWFAADGSGLVYFEADDNSTDTSTSTGVTVLATDWKTYRLEVVNLGEVHYYIDGVRKGIAAMTATGANAVLQPYLGLYKASGTSVGTMLIDYVRCWQRRS